MKAAATPSAARTMQNLGSGLKDPVRQQDRSPAPAPTDEVVVAAGEHAADGGAVGPPPARDKVSEAGRHPPRRPPVERAAELVHSQRQLAAGRHRHRRCEAAQALG